MTRRQAIFACLIPVTAARSEVASREFYYRVLEVEKHWDAFVRNLFGCKPEPAEANTENCHPQSGKIDYAAFMRWSKAAQRLIDGKS